MLADRRVRRIGVVPNHYALGYTANGMSVWDVDDERIDTLGPRVGALPFVSHCYRRPRRPPEWPYNLFAMVHARSREEVADKLEVIRNVLGPALRTHDVLYSTRILKKTGLRLS
jgi:DNA-binding Lrp family transcriptional regulator